jgi:hypothetical protein
MFDMTTRQADPRLVEAFMLMPFRPVKVVCLTSGLKEELHDVSAGAAYCRTGAELIPTRQFR